MKDFITPLPSFCSRFQTWKRRFKVFARASKLGNAVSKFLLAFPNLEKLFPSFYSCFQTWKNRFQAFARVSRLGNAVAKYLLAFSRLEAPFPSYQACRGTGNA